MHISPIVFEHVSLRAGYKRAESSRIEWKTINRAKAISIIHVNGCSQRGYFALTAYTYWLCESFIVQTNSSTPNLYVFIYSIQNVILDFLPCRLYKHSHD